MTMDFLGEHPSVPIGVAILIAVYLGACRVIGRRPSRRQAMWFALAMAAILYAHTELDELADARIFSMHMLQHLMETFVIPPLLLLGTPAWMIQRVVLNRAIKPIASAFRSRRDGQRGVRLRVGRDDGSQRLASKR